MFIFVIFEFLLRVFWDMSDVLIDFLLNFFDCVCSLEWFKLWYENNMKRIFGNVFLYICNMFI